MKGINTFCLALSILFIGCSSNKQNYNELTLIDASKNYPEKEINITDIADISYVYLDSKNDDFLFKGSISYVTKNKIVVIDRSSHSILFFSKDGNSLSRFNRKGSGPEEYIDAASVMYDEDKDDVYVSPDFSNHIMVYSSTGDFKRKINLPQMNVNGQMELFDDNSIMVYDNTKLWRSTMSNNLEEEQVIDSTFFLISKTDGAVKDYIQIPNKNIDLSYEDLNGGFIGQVSYGRIRRTTNGLLLYNPENDTVYHYSKEKLLTPYFHKTPILDKSNTKLVMDICLDVGKYHFISIYSYQETGKAPSPKYYMHNKDTGEIFRQKISLSDYAGKELFINPRLSSYYEQSYHFELDFSELEDAFRENKLKGELKEIVSSLINEEDNNNIFVFVDFHG